MTNTEIHIRLYACNHVVGPEHRLRHRQGAMSPDPFSGLQFIQDEAARRAFQFLPGLMQVTGKDEISGWNIEDITIRM